MSDLVQAAWIAYLMAAFISVVYSLSLFYASSVTNRISNVKLYRFDIWVSLIFGVLPMINIFVSTMFFIWMCVGVLAGISEHLDGGRFIDGYETALPYA